MNRNGLKTRSMMRWLKAGETGSAIVETALTMPMLLLLVLGAAEFANVAYASLEVTSAAKAGVSYGAQNGGYTADTNGIGFAAINDAPNLQTLSVKSISSTYACSDGSAPGTNGANCSHIEQTLTVVTTATVQPLIHIAGLPTQYTLTGQASQLCLQ